MKIKDETEFDPSHYPAARLFGHILTKGLQVGSVLGVSVVLPIAYLCNSTLQKDSVHKLVVCSAAGGVTLSGLLGMYKMARMDREGMEDRVYRLHYNESQNRLDRMNTVFGLFGAGSVGLMTGVDPYSIIAGFTMGTAAAFIADQLTAPQRTDLGKIVLFFKKHSITPNDLREVLAIHPLFSELSVEDQITPVVNFLRCTNVRDTGLSPRLTTGQLRTVLTKQPTVFEASLDYEIQPKCRFFIRDMKLNQQQVARLITQTPSILQASLESIKERVFFLHNRLAEMHQIASILERFPELLEVSMSSLNKLHAIWKEHVLTDKYFIIMIDRYPALLKLSVEEILKPMIQYLIFMCRHKRGARILIMDPTLFEISLNELAPKIEYLMRLGFESKEFVAMVVSTPEILRMDLELEIKPRIQNLIKSGILSSSKVARILHEQPSILTQTQPKTENFKLEQTGVSSCPII
eukprot:g1101.t1